MYCSFFPLPRRDTVPSVSLNIDEQDRKGINEDISAHHLLQQHLYCSRKNVGHDSSHSPKLLHTPQFHTLACWCFSPQHRHRYSRSDFTINQNEDEVQEIFQRTMRSRLESFKSAKMGVTPAKKITKHPKKETNQKVRAFFPPQNKALSNFRPIQYTLYSQRFVSLTITPI